MGAIREATPLRLEKGKPSGQIRHTRISSVSPISIPHSALSHPIENREVLTDPNLLGSVGTPQQNPLSQLKSTTYLRIFAQAGRPEIVMALLKTFSDQAMQHFSGFHCSLDLRTALPIPYVAFYPALVPQSSLSECINLLLPSTFAPSEISITTISAGHPPQYESLSQRNSYDPTSPVPLSTFGPIKHAPLGDIALARSGDKGPNLNFGLFVRSASAWDWLRSFMTIARMQELLGEDWRPEFFIERVEFPKIWAVHFVVYGILGRGVSSSTRLDGLGKGFADFVRDRVVDIPVGLLEERRRGKL